VAAADERANLAEQLVNRIIRPLDLVIISRDRLQQTFDEAAERGRVTRADANELVAELVNRGRAQTDDLLGDLERMLDRGREQIESATRRVRGSDSVDALVRAGDRARRTVGVGPSFPILGYDDLTAGQVEQRLAGLRPAELRKVRDYERRHANRKSVLSAVERALD
jgi:polyhydroxyalkanoate synthesis regulator phasin